MTPEIVLTACSMLLIFGLTPGPSSVRAATISVSQGVPTGLLFSAGVGIGYACILLISGCLLDTSRSVGPGLEPIQQIAGAVLVCWMSLKIILSKPLKDQPLTLGAARGTIQNAIVLQFVNPKAWIAGFIVMEGATTSVGTGTLIWWVLPSLCFAILFFSVAVWVLAGGLLRPMLSNAVRFRAFHATMGLCLMGTLFPAITG